jgi:hypothetical protein
MRETGGAIGLQEPKSLQLSSTSVTDVLAVSAGDKATYFVHGVIIVNDDSTARLVNIYRTEDTTDYSTFSATVGGGETMTVGFDAPLKLYAKSTARKIRAKAAAANVVTVTVLYAIAGQTKDESAS